MDGQFSLGFCGINKYRETSQLLDLLNTFFCKYEYNYLSIYIYLILIEELKAFYEEKNAV